MAARRAALGALPSCRLPIVARRTASTVETVKVKAKQNRSALIYSAASLAVLFAGVAYVSGTPSDKRKAALKKIDRARKAAATPSIVASKASEAKASSPEPDSSQEDASQEAAFNPETGEINWDCPCLGGMAHGTCGDEFKEAFSCFVFSDAEPKGIDCVDKFNAMQKCFREHPKEYAEVIKDDEKIDEEIEGGSDADHEFRHAQSAGRQSGGAGIAGQVAVGAKKVKDSVEDLVERTQEAIEGNPSVRPPKYAQEHNEGKALRQPGGGDDDHKSSHASSSGQDLGSGYNESADHHVAGDAGSSSAAKMGTAGGHDSLGENTPNATKGEKDGLGRNAATGSKPSGSDKAHEQHKEGVKATREGSDKHESTKDRKGGRG